MMTMISEREGVSFLFSKSSSVASSFYKLFSIPSYINLNLRNITTNLSKWRKKHSQVNLFCLNAWVTQLNFFCFLCFSKCSNVLILRDIGQIFLYMFTIFSLYSFNLQVMITIRNKVSRKEGDCIRLLEKKKYIRRNWNRNNMYIVYSAITWQTGWMRNFQFLFKKRQILLHPTTFKATTTSATYLLTWLGLL